MNRAEAKARPKEPASPALGSCFLSAAGFKALVEAAWPALTVFGVLGALEWAFDGFPALEELDLPEGPLDAADVAPTRVGVLRTLCCKQRARRS